MVLYRGVAPADILFIGEAPDESEDGIGYPFVGAAGRQLDSMVFAAYAAMRNDGQCMELSRGYVGNARGHITYGITNILGCIPRTASEVSGGEIRPPKKDEAAACQPRLVQIMEIANPRMVVLLGDIAKRFFPKVINAKLPRWNEKVHCLVRPARILHLQEESPNDAALLEKKFVISLSEAMKELF